MKFISNRAGCRISPCFSPSAATRKYIRLSAGDTTRSLTEYLPTRARHGDDAAADALPARIQDGRGEYEASKSGDVLVIKEFRINEEDISEIAKLGATEGVQKALEKYPAYNHGIDSSREITVEIYTEAGRKRISLTNFFAADRENKDHYPASLISLMEKVEEPLDPAHGVGHRASEHHFLYADG
jgi:hypothetical protein